MLFSVLRTDTLEQKTDVHLSSKVSCFFMLDGVINIWFYIIKNKAGVILHFSLSIERICNKVL